jgi:hypothetical protein
LISLGLSFAESFKVIFDNDKGGTDAIKKYKDEFGSTITNHFIFYSNNLNTCLEDLISDKDATFLMKTTKSKTIKKSLGIFFYDYKDSHKDFVKGISQETINNFKSVFDSINSL